MSQGDKTSHQKQTFFSGGNSCVPSASHNLFFSGGNYKFPIYPIAKSLRPFGSKRTEFERQRIYKYKQINIIQVSQVPIDNLQNLNKYKNTLMKNLIIFFIISIFVSCSFRDTKKNTYNADCIEKQESFNDFITSFHTNDAFMKSRVEKSITGFNSDDYDVEDTSSVKYNYIWKRGDVFLYLKEDIKDAYHSPDYKKEYKCFSNNDIEEYIYIQNSSCFYKCTYRIKKGKWYLIKLIVCTM